jgi:hypothetical protein
MMVRTAVAPSELAAKPELYSGRRIRVVGLCSMVFECHGLFTTFRGTSPSPGGTRQAIWIDVERSERTMALNGHVVVAAGVFDATRRGHLGIWSGTLVVEAIEPFLGEEAEVITGAIVFVETHFERINSGELEAAKEQLYRHERGLGEDFFEKPMAIYLSGMHARAPFRILSIAFRWIVEPRTKPWGTFVSVWLDVTAAFGAEERSTHFVVWWFPETLEHKIAARPSEWVTTGLGKR